MQIELETAEDLRSELDTNGTAQELKYVCLVNGGGRRSLRAD